MASAVIHLMNAYFAMVTFCYGDILQYEISTNKTTFQQHKKTKTIITKYKTHQIQ